MNRPTCISTWLTDYPLADGCATAVAAAFLTALHTASPQATPHPIPVPHPSRCRRFNCLKRCHRYGLFQTEYNLTIYASGAYLANATQNLVCRNAGGDLLHIGGPLLIAQLFRCVSAVAAAEAAALIAELELLVAQMDAHRPWAHPRAAEFDAITWDAFVSRRLGHEARTFINRGYAPGLSDAPRYCTHVSVCPYRVTRGRGGAGPGACLSQWGEGEGLPHLWTLCKAPPIIAMIHET